MPWSSDFAYAVGLITTDGSLSKDGRHFDLTSKDLEQIVNFRKILRLRNKIGIKRSSPSNSRIYYHVQFGNVKLYRFLLSIGLMPRKTKRMREIKIPRRYFADFLRGHFDGDGYSYIYRDRRWKASYQFYFCFTSSNFPHLKWLKDKIENLYKISGTISQNERSRAYYLKFSKTKAKALLPKIYYSDKVICLSRKRFKIEKSWSIMGLH